VPVCLRHFAEIDRSDILTCFRNLISIAKFYGSRALIHGSVFRSTLGVEARSTSTIPVFFFFFFKFSHIRVVMWYLGSGIDSVFLDQGSGII